MDKENSPHYPYGSADQVENAFYKAFSEGDFNLMESLIADSGVSYSHFGQTEIVGRKKVIDNWQFLLSGIPRTKISREILNITQSDGIETHIVLETFLANEKTGKISKIITTNTFVEQDNGWRLQMQKTSLPN